MDETPQPSSTLVETIQNFLAELRHANRSAHTLRAYATDLQEFTHFYSGTLHHIDTQVLREFFNQHTHLSPASRSRKQASIASFLKWLYLHEIIDLNPMQRMQRVKLETPAPKGVPRQQVEQVLAVIPRSCPRDALLFRLIFETGVRVSEALNIHVEEVDLTLDDERIQVLGKGQRQRTLLLDDPILVQQLKKYLKQTSYTYGPLFRAQKNGNGGPLRYQSAQELWAKYCTQAGIHCTLHQLRHTHATELLNDGVSLATIRKRLGHKSLQSTLRYAQQSDATADAELRSRRRRRNRQANS